MSQLGGTLLRALVKPPARCLLITLQDQGIRESYLVDGIRYFPASPLLRCQRGRARGDLGGRSAETPAISDRPAPDQSQRGLAVCIVALALRSGHLRGVPRHRHPAIRGRRLRHRRSTHRPQDRPQQRPGRSPLRLSPGQTAPPGNSSPRRIPARLRHLSPQTRAHCCWSARRHGGGSICRQATRGDPIPIRATSPISRVWSSISGNGINKSPPPSPQLGR